jgi:hypothetical protein
MSEPHVELNLLDDKPWYAPGDTLQCAYRCRDVDLASLQAIETSVLFHTEGKGQEDIGVHFFRRMPRREIGPDDLQRTLRFVVHLPSSPLSYDGAIIKVRWSVRVRLFFRRGRHATFERQFRMGCTSSPAQWPGRMEIEGADEAAA